MKASQPYSGCKRQADVSWCLGCSHRFARSPSPCPGAGPRHLTQVRMLRACLSLMGLPSSLDPISQRRSRRAILNSPLNTSTSDVPRGGSSSSHVGQTPCRPLASASPAVQPPHDYGEDFSNSDPAFLPCSAPRTHFPVTSPAEKRPTWPHLPLDIDLQFALTA